MDLLNLLYLINIDENTLRELIKKKHYSIEDINNLLSDAIIKKHEINDVLEKNLIQQFIDDFFYIDLSTNTLCGEYNQIMADILCLYKDINNIDIYKIKFDFGNMFSVAKYISDNDDFANYSNDLNMISYTNHILKLIKESISVITEKYGYILIRDDIDEFSILLSCDSKKQLTKKLDSAMKNIQLFAKETSLDCLPHSKSNRKGGIFITTQIFELSENDSFKKLSYKWDKFYNYKEQSSPSKIKFNNYMKTIYKLNNIEGKSILSDIKEYNDLVSTIIKDNQYKISEFLRPNEIRMRLLINYLDIVKPTNKRFLINLYKSLHNQESPFDIIHSSISYSKDIQIYNKILHIQKLSVHVISISWLNWAGIINNYGETSVYLVNKWIQKILIESIYNDDLMYKNSRFYDDSGKLIIFQFQPLINKNGSAEYIKKLLNHISSYVNKMPVRYVIGGNHKDTFKDVRDPRNNQNSGIKFCFAVMDYDQLKKVNFSIPITKIYNNKNSNHSIYGSNR